MKPGLDSLIQICLFAFVTNLLLVWKWVRERKKNKERERKKERGKEREEAGIEYFDKEGDSREKKRVGISMREMYWRDTERGGLKGFIHRRILERKRKRRKERKRDYKKQIHYRVRKVRKKNDKADGERDLEL
jgi:hypothetical protein